MASHLKENIYHSTSVAHTTNEWEIEFNKENKEIYLYDEFALIEDMNNSCDLEYLERFRIGESLISFFEIDLEKYNKQVDEFYSEYRKYNFKPEKIRQSTLDGFVSGFEHPYFFSLDTAQLSKMHWDEAYQYLKINLENATTLYNLIKGLCHNQLVPLDPQNNFFDRQWDYISEVESIMLDLFRKTSTLQQRLHYSISVDANEYSIHSFKLINRYSNINPLSFAFTEFQKMLEWDIPIRCCKNCNKLFIPDTKHAVDYCNRVDSETGLTCKKIGASAQYRSKVNQNPILKEYTKAYKRNYARIGKPGMTNDQFRIWVDEATKKRDELATEYTSNPSEQLVVAFKKYLGNK